MLDFDKFTNYSQEILASANNIMASYKNTQMEPEHILMAMIKDKGIAKDYLEELKHELGTVIDEYEDEGASEDTLDTLTEVLDAMEDAVDGIFDVLEEE